MNQAFLDRIKYLGPEGKTWLSNIPHIIAQKEHEWQLRVNDPFPNLTYNYVASAQMADGSMAVIKIGFPKDREFFSEMDALRVFGGSGIERIYEKDRENAVMLLEKVTPGNPLSSLSDDEEATRILAHVMKKLWKPLPKNHSFITIREWMRELPMYMQKHKGDGPLPWNLVQKANELFDELLATSTESMLLHGDLHHDNVLRSDRNEWLAIDPKGIAGEPAYETAAMIRNPYKKMRDTRDLSSILKRRISILSEELEFDPKRIQKWCFAQSILSAVWNDAGPKGSEHAIRIAEALNELVE